MQYIFNKLGLYLHLSTLIYKRQSHKDEIHSWYNVFVYHINAQYEKILTVDFLKITNNRVARYFLNGLSYS